MKHVAPHGSLGFVQGILRPKALLSWGSVRALLHSFTQRSKCKEGPTRSKLFALLLPHGDDQRSAVGVLPPLGFGDQAPPQGRRLDPGTDVVPVTVFQLSASRCSDEFASMFSQVSDCPAEALVSEGLDVINPLRRPEDVDPPDRFLVLVKHADIDEPWRGSREVAEWEGL